MGQKFCKQGIGSDRIRNEKRDYGSLPAMAATIVEEFVFKVDFIGSALLPKDGTGLSMIQKPLKELYLENCKKTGSTPRSQERQLKVRPEGILMTFRDTTGLTRHAFYDLASIHYFEAVTFHAFKGIDKKLRGIFEPLSKDTKLRSNVSSFSLDKKFSHLADREHPPMFACVIRRHSSVKALDCFVFITSNKNEALQIASIMSANKVSNRMGRLPLPDSSLKESVSSTYKPVGSSNSNYLGTSSGHESLNTSQSRYDTEKEHLLTSSKDATAFNVKDDGYLYPYPNNNDPSVISKECTHMQVNNRHAMHSGSKTPTTRRPVSMDEVNLKRHVDNARPRFDSDDSPVYRHFDECENRKIRPIDESLAEYRPFVEESYCKDVAHDACEEPMTPVFSMSNLESRQEMEKSHSNVAKTESTDDSLKSRPVAKVPPHLVAGVKVLPTNIKLPSKKPSPTHSPKQDRPRKTSGQSNEHPPPSDHIRYHIIEDMGETGDTHGQTKITHRKDYNRVISNSLSTHDVATHKPHSHQYEADRHNNGEGNSLDRHVMSNRDKEFVAYSARQDMVLNPYNRPESPWGDRHKHESSRNTLHTSYSANPTYSDNQWSVQNDHAMSHSSRQHAEQIGFNYLSVNESPRREETRVSDQSHHRSCNKWSHHQTPPKPSPRPHTGPRYDSNPGLLDHDMGLHKEPRDRYLGQERNNRCEGRETSSMEKSLGYFP